MVLTAVTAVAGAEDPVSPATGVITDYSKNKNLRRPQGRARGSPLR